MLVVDTFEVPVLVDTFTLDVEDALREIEDDTATKFPEILTATTEYGVKVTATEPPETVAAVELSVFELSVKTALALVAAKPEKAILTLSEALPVFVKTTLIVPSVFLTAR